MEEEIPIDLDITIAEVLRQRKGKNKKHKRKADKENNTQTSAGAGVILPNTTTREDWQGNIRVSLFDNSVDNFFRDMDINSKLCGEVESDFQFDSSEIKRLSSSITFLKYYILFISYEYMNIRMQMLLHNNIFCNLMYIFDICREWRYFNYQPRDIRFTCQSESAQGKDVIGKINLPQFSSAAVPKVPTGKPELRFQI